MDTEILVHIKAPSRFADDKRYAALAQGVLDFKPTKLIRVTDNCVGPDDVHAPSPGLSISTCLGSNKSIPLAGSLALEDIHTNPLKTGALNSRSSDNNVHRVSKNSRETRRRKVQSMTNNPPYRSPLRKRCYTESDIDNSCTTPDATVLSAALQSGARILVPNTERRSLKRALSNTLNSSFESLVIANSQPAQFRDNTPSSLRQSITAIQSQNTLNKHWSNQRSPETTTNAPLLDQGVISIEQPHLSFTSSDLETSPNLQNSSEPLLPARSSNAALQKQCSTDHESEALCDMAGDESTLTISDRSLLPVGHHTPVADDQLSVLPASIADLEPPKSSVDNSRYQQKHGTQALDTEAPQLLSCRGADHETIDFDSSGRGYVSFAIEKLPLVINGPDPTVAELAKPSYDKPFLRATAEALGLPKRFKPEKVFRSISRRERGYWNIPITITEHEPMRPIKSQINDEQKDNQDCTWRPLLKYDSLTEAEFLQIWKELERFISSGNAGWSIKVVRRRFCALRNEDGVHEGFRFYLHVYCYGEAIPYVYAMLLICTRMYTLCKPLEWVSTLDEQTVVTMTGDESRKGKLGEWTQYRNKQGRIMWNCQRQPIAGDTVP